MKHVSHRDGQWERPNHQTGHWPWPNYPLGQRGSTVTPIAELWGGWTTLSATVSSFATPNGHFGGLQNSEWPLWWLAIYYYIFFFLSYAGAIWAVHFKRIVKIRTIAPHPNPLLTISNVKLQKIITTELSTTTWVQWLNFHCRSFGNEISSFGHTVKIHGSYSQKTPW